MIDVGTDPIKQGLIAFMKSDSSLDEAIEKMVAVGASRDTVSERAAELRAQMSQIVNLKIPRALVDRAEVPDPPWYVGSTDNDVCWPALQKEFLDAGLSYPALTSIDDASFKIVSSLRPPYQQQIATRGLVLGHVQSGKTSNFTAVAAKAADAGYRMVIVLSGVHNNLRRQTQVRLDKQLVDPTGKHWVRLTDVDHDFGGQGAWTADQALAYEELRFLCVMKKNASRLQKLVNWLGEASPRTLAHVPILVIDDEADQAGINTSRNPAARTRINELMVQLLSFPKVAYVGYTATPFANLFVDPTVEDDLYPRSFIMDLPRPDGYFGPERLFGRLRLDGDESDPDDGLDVIRRIEAPDLARLAPPPRGPARDSWNPELPPSLREAVLYFVLATAARRARGHTGHSTMLIHTTPLTDIHFLYRSPVNALIAEFAAGIRAVDRDVLGELESLWQEESSAVDSLREFELASVTFDELAHHLPAVLGDVTIVIDNYRSLDRLDYGEEPKTVIVIGGNTLSRGLTLEGLVVSYFARIANAYDTLLQMGRWFGYRPGYGDLPRVWLTDQLEEWFRHLATVEAEIRLDIEKYEADGVTPLNFATRIRTHPKLRITSALKMQHTTPTDVCYSDRLVQTILFNHRDANWVAANRQAAADLVSELPEFVELSPSRWMATADSAAPILGFLGSYRFHENALDLNSELVAAYIRDQNAVGDLNRWNVVVLGDSLGNSGTIDLGLPSPVNMNSRSRMRSSATKPYADIKALVSKRDRVADLDVARDLLAGTHADLQALRPLGIGLLLLYPISANSTPDSRHTARMPLDAVDDLIGAAIVFPAQTAGAFKGVSYMQVDLGPVNVLAHDERLDAEQAEAEAEAEDALEADDEADFVIVRGSVERRF